MLDRFTKMLVLAVFLLAIFASCKKCQNGQILVLQNCISCTKIQNTEYSQALQGLQQENQCPCKQGFKWSRVLNQCILFTPPIQQNRLLIDDAFIIKDAAACNTTSQYFNPGLNQCVCDPTKNYAPVNTSCISCALALFSNGFANDLGCICRNGLSWSSTAGLCICPSKSVFIGNTCTTCATAKFPTGVTATDCNSCTNSKGFVTQKIGCFLCSSQNGASTTVSNGVCTCTGKGQVWRPLIGSCVCDWAQLYVTSISSTGFSCQKCPYILSGNNSVCPCGILFLQNDSQNQICTDISFDPNSNLTGINNITNTITCKQGYRLNKKKFPYTCVPGISASAGFYNSATQKYAACTSTGCSSCDLAAGYLLIVDINQCLLCSTVTGSTGVASTAGCECQTGRQWNSLTLTCDSTTCSSGMIYQPNSKTCICDPVNSILIGTKCIACSSISQSNGFAANSTSCACNFPLFWVANSVTGGSCTNTTCNLATQIVLLSGSCFTCPTSTNNGAGASNGVACLCSSNYIWNATLTGGSCICDFSKAYLATGKCTVCPVGTTGGDGKGGCNCASTFTWIVSGATGSCKLCNTLPNIVLLSNGKCITCGAANTFTIAGKADKLNKTCTCITGLSWNVAGFCECSSSSVMIITGNAYSCFSCNNATAFTNGKVDNYSCSCISNNLVWSATNKMCGCPSPSSIVVGSGSTTSCFTCVIGGYIVGTSADQTACLCIGNLVWLPLTKQCGCSDATQIIVGSGINVQCVTCLSRKYGKAPINSSTCSCQGTGLVFNPTCEGVCQCPLGSIILPSFTCFACPSGSTPLTPYECLCSSGFIWNYATQSCVQCGTSTIPNSLPNGGTNFACVCGNGYIWDVMTQSCILSTACPTSAPSCMKCPTGQTATKLVTPARSLNGASIIQGSINALFTNYNKIKGYQCNCASGYSWDSLRLKCFSTNLQ